MPKKCCPIFVVYPQCKNGQDLLDSTLCSQVEVEAEEVCLDSDGEDETAAVPAAASIPSQADIMRQYQFGRSAPPVLPAAGYLPGMHHQQPNGYGRSPYGGYAIPPAVSLKRKREPATIVLSGRKVTITPFSRLPKAFLAWAGADKENEKSTAGYPDKSGILPPAGYSPYGPAATAQQVQFAAMQYAAGFGGGRFGMAPQQVLQAGINPLHGGSYGPGLTSSPKLPPSIVAHRSRPVESPDGIVELEVEDDDGGCLDVLDEQQSLKPGVIEVRVARWWL